MPDNNLRIAAEFDVSQVVAGTQQAASSFEQMASKIDASARQASVATEMLYDKAAKLGVQMMADSASAGAIISAMQRLGLSQAEAATLMQLLTDEAVQQAIALKNGEAAADSFAGGSRNSFAIARTEAAVLSGNIAGVERGLAQIAARSETLGPIMQKAFSLFLIVAFIELLEQAADAIGNAMESIAGFGKEVQKEYIEAIAFNERLVNVNLEAQDKVDKIAAIGKEGAAKYAIESKNAEESTQRWAQRLGELNKELPAAQAELQRLTSAASRWNDPLAGLTDVDFQLEKQKAHVQELTKEWESLNIKMKELPIEAQSRAAEEFARRQQDAIANTKAAIDAEQRVGLARITNQEAIDKELFELSRADLEKQSDEYRAAVIQQTRDLEGEEDKRYAIQHNALMKQREEAVKEGATGKNVVPELTKLDADIETLALEHQRRLGQITAAGQAQINEINRKAREDEEKAQEAEAKRTEEDAKKELESIERAMIEKVRIQAEAAKQQLAEAEKEAEQQRKLDLGSIFGETSKTQIDDATKALQGEEAQVANLISMYERLAAQLIALGNAQDSPKVLELMRQEQTAIGQLDRAWQQYQSVVDQVALHQEQVMKQAFDRITSTLNNGLVDALDKSRTFGQAMEQVWNSLASTAIKNILTIVEQQALALLTQQTLLDSQKLDDAKGAASGAYRSVMESGIPFPLNFALAVAMAGAAFAAVMAFERGGLVPGTAGEAQPALLHGGEMVLPQKISGSIQGAIPAMQTFNQFVSDTGGNFGRNAAASTGSGARTPGPIEVHLHQHGGDASSMIKSQGDLVKMVRRAVRAGYLPDAEALST